MNLSAVYRGKLKEAPRRNLSMVAGKWRYLSKIRSRNQRKCDCRKRNWATCFLVWIRPEERDFQQEGLREIAATAGEWRASSSEQEGGKMRKLGEDEESHGILKNLGWGRLKEDSMALIPHEDAFS